MRWISYITLLLAACYLTACSTKLKIVSAPEKATIYVVKGNSNEKKKLGETPFEKSDDELRETFGEFGQPGEFVSLVLEKKDYQSKQIWLPLSASGVIESEINVNLKKDTVKTNELNTAKTILDKMFLAQRYAITKQFERALIEIDKILELFPDFARAMSMKASIYYAKGDFKESLEWYEKALDVEPEMKNAIDMSASVRKKLRLPARVPPPASLPPGVK